MRGQPFDGEARPGTPGVMKWRKRMRIDKDGVSLAADVNAAISVNRGQSGATNQVRSVSHVQVVQDSRRARQDRASESEDERKEHT